jgi:hypothetical protein
MSKSDMKAAFRAGWSSKGAGVPLDALFEKWYDDYTASRPLETSRRKGW